MKYQHRGFAASITGVLVAIGLAGAVGCATDEPKVGDEAASEAQQALGGSIVITTYYSEAAHINVVGSCVLTTCPGAPKGRHCQGIKTSFFENETDSCNGGP